jgi:hypothetical protein
MIPDFQDQYIASNLTTRYRTSLKNICQVQTSSVFSSVATKQQKNQVKVYYLA